MKHSLQRSFASVVTIWEVLCCGQHKFGLKESMRSNQTAKTYEGSVNPIALLLSNRQLRLRESKHAELYNKPFVPPQDYLWNAMPAVPHAPALRIGSVFQCHHFSQVLNLDNQLLLC